MKLRRVIFGAAFLLLFVELELAVGPLQIRGQEAAVATLAVGLLTFGLDRPLRVPKPVVGVCAPLVILFLYGTLLLPIQPYSVLNSVVDLVDLFVIVIGALLLAALLETREDGALLFDVAVYSASAEAIVYFAFFGILGSTYTSAFSVPPHFPAVGIPAVGLLVAYQRYTWQGGLLNLGLAALLGVRVVSQLTRSFYVLVPATIVASYVVLRPVVTREQTRRVLRSAGAVLVTATVALAVPGLLGGLRSQLIREVISLTQLSGGLFVRPAVWFMAVTVYLQHPLGVGLGNAHPALNELVAQGFSFPPWFVSLIGSDSVNRVVSQFPEPPGVHSSVFAFLLYAGIVGLGAFVAFWYQIARAIFRRLPDRPPRTRQEMVPLLSLTVLVYLLGQSIANTQILTGRGLLIIAFLLPTLYPSSDRATDPSTGHESKESENTAESDHPDPDGPVPG
jgi:hypothetical protein